MPVVHTTEEGKIVLARNFSYYESQGITGSRSQPAGRGRTIYDVWSKDGWIKQRHYAMTFETKDAAEQYLNEHPELFAN